VKWKREGGTVTLTQRTRFPEETSSELTIDTAAPARFTLKLRVPWWAGSGIAVAVNGKPWSEAVRAYPSTWLSLEREWSKGDRVTVYLPMKLRTQPINDDPNLRAVLYGPVVLAGLMENPQRRMDLPTPVLTGDFVAPWHWIEPVAGKTLTFRTKGQPEDLTLMPLYKIVDESYGVYWRFAAKGSLELRRNGISQRMEQVRERRTVDQVICGNAASETAHGVQANKASLWHQAYVRELASDGVLSYRLKVAPGIANSLAATFEFAPYLGHYVVSVDGKPVSVMGTPPAKGIAEVHYLLDAAQLQGKRSVTVQVALAPKPGYNAGHVFGFTMLRASRPAAAPAAPAKK
jgi:hypothetical protein